MAEHDKPAIDAALAKAFNAFAVLNDQLEKTPYLAGQDFTYADIVAGVAMHRWSTMTFERPAMPGVEAWHQRLLARPAFQKAVCISYAELVGKKSF